jgi:hypothetical protein
VDAPDFRPLFWSLFIAGIVAGLLLGGGLVAVLFGVGVL